MKKLILLPLLMLAGCDWHPTAPSLEEQATKACIEHKGVPVWVQQNDIMHSQRLHCYVDGIDITPEK